MDRVLITGGTGFVGYWMLLQKPNMTYVCSLNQAAYESMQWTTEHWDYIVHLAPVSPEKVIEYAKIWNTRVLFASSGAARRLPVPPTQYGRDKRMWEDELAKSEIGYTIARLFTFCGWGLRGLHYAINDFIDQALRGRPIHIKGDGKTVRSYMYGWDVGHWMWRILRWGEQSRIYEVGSEHAVTMQELAAQVQESFAHKLGIIIENRKLDEPEKIYVPELVYLTKEKLGLEESFTFPEVIDRAVRDYVNEHMEE